MKTRTEIIGLIDSGLKKMEAEIVSNPSHHSSDWRLGYLESILAGMAIQHPELLRELEDQFR